MDRIDSSLRIGMQVGPSSYKKIATNQTNLDASD